jgi:hypothetical protein
MSKMTRFQAGKCAEITDKLTAQPICSPFVEAVAPKGDGDPPRAEPAPPRISLSDVARKLAANEYDSVQAWERDINCIWSNARATYVHDPLFTNMTMEAALWFNRKMKKFPATQEEEWAGRIQRSAKNLLDVLSHPPTELDPSGKLAANAGSSDDDRSAADD